MVAVLGTTISPYLFFWQASHEVEEEKARGRRTVAQRRGATAHELADARLDVATGMFFSNLVMFFIILATGATLHAAGQTQIDSARQAAEALRPLAGDGARIVLFAMRIDRHGAPGRARAGRIGVVRRSPKLFALARGARPDAPARAALLPGLRRCRGSRAWR